MSPLGQALLQSWDWRVEVILILLLAGGLYLRGWRRLQGRTKSRVEREWRNPRPPLIANWKPISYLAGLLVVAIALMSPIDVLGSQLFYMHMIQHLLLVMIAPPLLLVASPFPVIVWGLPPSLRRRVSGLLNQRSALRRVLAAAGAPGLVWFLYISVYVGWHDPGLYDLALRSDLVHDLEHLTFFGTAMLFWWHVTGAAPRFRRTFGSGQRLLYVIAAIPANMFTGIAIAFANEPIYPYYEAVPRFYGVSVMEDQMLSGVIMWIPGSMMFLLAALVLISRIVQSEVDKPIQVDPKWLVEPEAVSSR